MVIHTFERLNKLSRIYSKTSISSHIIFKLLRDFLEHIKRKMTLQVQKRNNKINSILQKL